MLLHVWGLKWIRMEYIQLQIPQQWANLPKKLFQRVKHSGCKCNSVDPERQTKDWVLDDSKVNTVTPSLAESKNTAEDLKGRYKDYKYLRKDKVKHRSVT